MREKFIVPVVGQIYTNRNGRDYRCTYNAAYSSDDEMKKAVALGEHRASMIRLSDGWAIEVCGLHQYEDGTVEWRHSNGGSFQSDALAQCWQACGTGMYKYFDYLDGLRDSGVTNMMGAIPYLQREFTELRRDYDKAKLILVAWMDSYSGHKDRRLS